MNNVFRTEYKKLDEATQTEIANLKDLAQVMHDLIKSRPCRESSLAATKLEECIMWAVKGITNY